MKYLLSIVFLIGAFNVSALPLYKYKVHIVTWDRDRITGKVESISDSTISIRINSGKIFTFSAVQTKNLKIWKPGINMPATITGAVMGIVVMRHLASKDDEWGLADALAIVIGLPLGSIAGLATGDLISTKFNKRRMHETDFTFLKNKLISSEENSVF